MPPEGNVVGSPALVMTLPLKILTKGPEAEPSKTTLLARVTSRL